MNLRQTHILALLLALALPAAARAASPEPRLVSVRLSSTLTAETLAQAGFDVVWSGAGEARILEHARDGERLAGLGIAGTVLDEHPGRTLAARARGELAARPALPARRVRSAARRDGVFRIESLPPFGSGSMAGYWTAAEIKMKLDQLVADDVNDVVAAKVDTLGLSGQGRPVWGLKLGKTVVGPDSRPVVFMNALTHAREPQGMQTLLYFVDDLLARYGTDPFATSLLDNRVLYVVPLVNPDGYAINENTYFSSGGMSFGYWRKNARDNNGNSALDGNDGVDLNRNFAHHWGDPGASAIPGDETYRGPSAASEIETRIQRDQVIALRPTSGLSFHTYSDLMIYPWGYTAAPPPDVAAFKEWSDELTRDNGYLSGQAPNILYGVSGEFNDWCYGDTLSKPRMVSWTPEVGTPDDDFWPPPSRIVPLAQENLRACTVVMAIAGPYVQTDGVSIVEGAMNAGHLAHVAVAARNLGITGAGPGLTGTITPLDAGVHVLRGSVAYPTLGSRQSGNALDTYQLAVDDTVTPGRLLRFQVAFDAPGGFYSRDTIAVPAGTPTQIAFDDASTALGKWSNQAGVWGIVANDAGHPSRYFSDSPTGPYGANLNHALTLIQGLNFSTVLHAYAFFESRWEFESDYDGSFIEASVSGVPGTWVPLATTGTTPASGVFGGLQTPTGAPMFAGSQRTWKPDRADLSAWTGAGKTAVRLRFRTGSDGGNPGGKLMDGFNFDSLRIVIYDPAAQPAAVAVGDEPAPNALELAPPTPNPARGLMRFEFALPRRASLRLEILDLQGRRVRTLGNGAFRAGRYVRGWDMADDHGRAVSPGVYLAKLSGDLGTLVRRAVVVR